MPDDPQTLGFEDFVLDLGRAELRKAGEVVTVEPQVFDLIAYLATNPDRVISRDELIEGVWKGRIVSDGAISTRINAARAALGDDGTAQRLIRTVPRRGFRFLGATSSPEEATKPRPGDTVESSGVRYFQSFDGTHLAYETLGSGLPLIKAPNFLGHIEYERSNPIWQGSIVELSRENRYVRMDQRGNGLSDRNPSEVSFDAFVRDLKALIDELGVERTALIGISQGASIAVEFAARWPELVSGLVLIGGYPAGWRKLGDPDFERRREAMIELMRFGWGGRNPAFRQMFSELFMPEGDHELREWFGELQRISAEPEEAARIMDALGDFDVRDRLAQVDHPTLVMHCRGDAMVPMEYGRRFAIGMPNARFVMLESDNHLPLEGFDCWPVFIRETRAFLAGLEAGQED